MGSGKSTVGARVAALLGRPFVDLDARVEERAQRSVRELWREEGEVEFRRRERVALGEILDAGGAPVVALGGGTLVEAGARALLRGRAFVVGLRAPVAVLAARLEGARDRPLLDGDDPARALERVVSSRRAAYELAHLWVDADAPMEEVAREIAEAARDRLVAVELEPAPYAVRITETPWPALTTTVRSRRPSKVFVVTDENVDALYGADVREALVASGVPFGAPTLLPVGEANKKLTAIEHALEQLVAGGADRSSLVVGVGGGVVTDMAGFAASIFMRGVPWVAVPTTLLAMVDASVGGKTGVDLGDAKNAVGSFHQPFGVIVGPSLSSSESARARRSGLAEGVKTLAVGDARAFEDLEAMASKGLPEAHALGSVIEASIAVKAGIVARDPREDGERAVLNFGHTLGHALEAATGFRRFAHGEAVALGMAAALRIGRELGVTPAAVEERVVGLLGRLGLDARLGELDWGITLPYLSRDKKRSGSSIRFVLLRELGQPHLERLDLDRLAALVRVLRP
jgi:shikimate kinase/3-dehydroquinate synthase